MSDRATASWNLKCFEIASRLRFKSENIVTFSTVIYTNIIKYVSVFVCKVCLYAFLSFRMRLRIDIFKKSDSIKPGEATATF